MDTAQLERVYRAEAPRITAALAARIGDVVAAPVGPFAIVATKAEPLESSLIGMHGSLTSADQLVPLLRLPAL